MISVGLAYLLNLRTGRNAATSEEMDMPATPRPSARPQQTKTAAACNNSGVTIQRKPVQEMLVAVMILVVWLS